MKKRIVALLLCLACVFGLCACGSQGAEQTGKTVVDGAGRTLAVPENGAEEKLAAVYGTAVPFIVAAGLSEQVVAVNCKSNFWKEAVAPLGAAGSVGRGVVDLEALAASGATVLVHRANDPKTVENVEKLGIDILCIQGENMKGIYATMELLGAYFGREERCKEVIDWMEAKFAAIDAIVADIPESERPTALVMGGELGRIAGGDMIQSWMVEKAGGVCVAADEVNDCNWKNVGSETVFTWDPEYIFCTSSTSLDYSVEEMEDDIAWSAIAAVRKGHTAVIPSKLDTWDMPGIAVVPGTFWMLHQMYPDRFGKAELEKEIEEYYQFMFGQSFDPEYLGYELS